MKTLGLLNTFFKHSIVNSVETEKKYMYCWKLKSIE